MGRPVVATAVGGLPELLAGWPGQLVAVDDSEAMAAATAALLADGARRCEMGRQMREYIEAEYHLSGMIDGYERVYREVCETDAGL